jgi:hypothetical protein
MTNYLKSYKKSYNSPIFWFESSDELMGLGFTKDEIATAINQAGETSESLTSFEYAEASNDTWFSNSDFAELVATGEQRHFEEIKIFKGQEFTRTYLAPANQYRVRGNYQSVKHPKILRNLLINKFPYLKKYKFEVFSMTSEAENWQIYVKVNKASLYTPVKALFEKNPEIIIQTMKDYHGGFRNKRNPNQKTHNHEEHEHQSVNGGCGLCQERFYQESMKPLKSVITRRFFEDLEK